MKPLLILALIAGQTFYEWTDAQGQSHYTDDPSTIPANAKRRVTQGAEPVLVTSTTADAGLRPGARDAGVPAQKAAPPQAPAGPNKCELALKKVQDLEQRIAQGKDNAAAEEQAINARCQEMLRRFGEASFAQCMAGRSRRPRANPLEKDLEAAKEELRRVKVDGCS